MPTSIEEIGNPIHDRAIRLAKKPMLWRDIFDRVPVGILLIDHEGIIMLANEEVGRIFKYAKAYLEGKVTEMLLPELRHEAHKALRNGYIDDPHVRPMGAGQIFPGRRSDGQEIPLRIHLNYVNSEDEQFFLAAIQRVPDSLGPSETVES